jgi:hypothetical protein
MGKLLLTLARSQWDRTTAMVAAVLSGLLLLLGYFGVASTPFPAEQVPYVVSGGIAGILLMGVAATLWLSADMRDEWRKLDELGELLRENGVGSAGVIEVEPAPAPPVERIEVAPQKAARSARRPRRAAAQGSGT